MLWLVLILTAVLIAAIIAGPFFIHDNAMAQGLFGLLTTFVATGIGVWTSWKYSRNSDKERLTRYGLLAWRNVDALSVKVRQQMQLGPASVDVLGGWLLDIDQAKWSWRDLLRELFELQERLENERDEVALKYKQRIDAAESATEKVRLETQQRLEMAKISARAPLPIPERLTINCPNCGKDVDCIIGKDIGATSWPQCTGCGALFPVHRKSPSEIVANPDAVKLPVRKECPKCAVMLEWKVPAMRPVRFLYTCEACHSPIQFSGSAAAFDVTIPGSAVP